MNITLALDEQLISAAKLVAARHNTSISALVRVSLEHQVALDAEAVNNGASGVLQELIDYSMGRRPRAVTMDALGIDNYGALLRLLNAANFARPLVPLAKRQAMAAVMSKMIKAQIQAARPNFRSDLLIDHEAEKIEVGTDWKPRFRPL